MVSDHLDLVIIRFFSTYTCWQIISNTLLLSLLTLLFTFPLPILLAHCPEQLKCDIVQVAHHGFAGATPELYKATQAHYALWPSTEKNMADNITREANDYLLHHSSIWRHLIGGNATLRLSFPPRNDRGDNLDITVESNG